MNRREAEREERDLRIMEYLKIHTQAEAHVKFGKSQSQIYRIHRKYRKYRKYRK